MMFKTPLIFSLVAICVAMAAARKHGGRRSLPPICGVEGLTSGELPCPGGAGCDVRLLRYRNNQVRVCDRPPRLELPVCKIGLNGGDLNEQDVCEGTSCDVMVYADEVSGYEIYKCSPPIPTPRLCAIQAPDNTELFFIECPHGRQDPEPQCGHSEVVMDNNNIALFCPPEELEIDDIFDDDSSSSSSSSRGRGRGRF